MESTIPGDMTVEGWRNHPLRKRRPAESCGHLCDTTTRYDHDAKLLHFLLVCPTCGTEKLIETQPYEPRFTQHVQDQRASAGATVHQLPVGRHKRSLPRAA
jgi:hypothetical protein